MNARLVILSRALVFGLLGSCFTACVGLHKNDAFPVASQPLNLALLHTQISPGSEVRSLRVSVSDRPVSAYYVRHSGAHGVLIFFGGSGNQVDNAIRGFDARTRALGLDLVVFSYYEQGEAVPTVAEVRERSRAIYSAVRSLRTPAAKSIYLLGHSLGGWFALDVAAREPVRGLALAGAETTPAEVIHRTDAPWANLVAIRPDEDARQLDASLYAPHVRARTLVCTSNADEAVPAVVGHEVFEMLPAPTLKRLIVLESVTHGRYFLSDEFWQQFAEFFGLRSSQTIPSPNREG